MNETELEVNPQHSWSFSFSSPSPSSVSRKDWTDTLNLLSLFHSVKLFHSSPFTYCLVVSLLSLPVEPLSLVRLVNSGSPLRSSPVERFHSFSCSYSMDSDSLLPLSPYRSRSFLTPDSLSSSPRLFFFLFFRYAAPRERNPSGLWWCQNWVFLLSLVEDIGETLDLGGLPRPSLFSLFISGPLSRVRFAVCWALFLLFMKSPFFFPSFMHLSFSHAFRWSTTNHSSL